jgi:ribosomal 50S subunit-associated protein YjgA (DUF615 family)
MDLEMVEDKQLHELERLGKEFLNAMKKAKLTEEPLYHDISALVNEAEKMRRARYDEKDNQYTGF